VEFTAPSKTASVPLTQNGLYIGTITRLDDEGAPFVEIPAILNNFSFGPCVFSGYTDGQIPTVGQKVICGFLNNALDEVVVIGKVPEPDPAPITVGIKEVTSGFWFAEEDSGKLHLGNGSSISAGVPSDSTADIAVGCYFTYQVIGTGSHLFYADSGVTINASPGPYLRTQYSVGTVVKTASNTWTAYGDLVV